VNNLEDAHELIDTAISTALKESKPVYISIGCNLPAIPHPTFARDPVPFFLAPRYLFCLLIIQSFFFFLKLLLFVLIMSMILFENMTIDSDRINQ
jgi:hypothetical protein